MLSKHLLLSDYCLAKTCSACSHTPPEQDRAKCLFRLEVSIKLSELTRFCAELAPP